MNLSIARRLAALVAIVLSLGCASSLVAQTTVTFVEADADGSTLSFNRNVTAGGTADFTFSSDIYLQYFHVTDPESYGGIYAEGALNELSGTALKITVTPGYVFDFNSFRYASDVPANSADNKLFLDVTYGDGGTGSMTFTADDSTNPAFLDSLETFANDITSITISTNGYAVIHDITVSDIHQLAPIPEPATVGAILGCAALVGSIAWRRRRTA